MTTHVQPSSVQCPSLVFLPANSPLPFEGLVTLLEGMAPIDRGILVGTRPDLADLVKRLGLEVVTPDPPIKCAEV